MTEEYEDNGTSIFDVSSGIDIVEGVQDPDIPSMTSPEWNDYVMALFLDRELIEIGGKKYPTCYGLRRLVRELVGDIIVSRPVEMQYPVAPVNKVTIRFEITVRNHLTGEIITYGDVASVSELNTDDVFLGYADETAATRAEGRCLRKLLGLNCVAAEELTREKNVAAEVKRAMNIKPTDGSFKGTDKASEAQRNFIVSLCKQLDLDVLDVINYGGKNFKNIDDDNISKDDGKDIIQTLNGYKSDRTKIPADLIRGK